MCKVLKVSRSGYYKWQKRPISQRREENNQILETIRIIRMTQPKKQSYGSPRLTRELNEKGIKCHKSRVAKIMQANGIKARIKRKFVTATKSGHKMPVAPNLLNQRFDVGEPTKAYVSDIAYIPTSDGWLYLAAVLDLFSRKITGWATSKALTAELVIKALYNTWTTQKPAEGAILHSDRGGQYACLEYRSIIERCGYVQSMSGVGNCYDNAVMESFFHTLKTEWVSFHTYKTRAEATSSIFDYIETFYNRERRHSKLNYLAPIDYEKWYYKSKI